MRGQQEFFASLELYFQLKIALEERGLLLAFPLLEGKARQW